VANIVRGIFCACALCFITALTACAAEPELKAHESKYYVIHSDLPDSEVREAEVRMTHMVDEYVQRTAGFSGQVTGRLPFYLYTNLADYTKAVGVEGTGGFFDGEKLLAATLRDRDGTIAQATWHIVQHEGFHQFARAVIGGDIPMWTDEGLGEYFGEGLFTGDGFVSGLIPQSRLVRIRKLLRDGEFKPFRQFLAITRDQWNDKVEMKNYDQAWSLVHFLAHGEDGRLQKPFVNFMQAVGKGEDAEKAYNRHLNSIPNLERRWRDWWSNLPDDPTAEGYARATLQTLTSFLARAHAQAQSFGSFDAFTKISADEIKQPPADWLPPGLFVSAAADAVRMRTAGDGFVLVKSVDRPPSIVLTLKDGTKLAGRFSLGKEGRVEAVRVDVLAKAPANARTPREPR